MVEIALPADALVVLVGASGAGKSTFARRHFAPTEILASDAFRALVADDEADQSATAPAFELLALTARHRLARGRLTAVDATSVRRRDRTRLIGLARAAGRPAIAVVLHPPLADCLRRNAGRPGRSIPVAVVATQHAELADGLAADPGLAGEGFATVVVLREVETIDEARVVRAPAVPRKMPAPPTAARR